MGFLSKAVRFGSGLAGKLKSVRSFGDAVAKKIEPVARVVSDVASLGALVFPELEVVSEGATAVADVSKGVSDVLEAKSWKGALDAGAKALGGLALDELKGLIPGVSQVSAASDLVKRTSENVDAFSKKYPNISKLINQPSLGTNSIQTLSQRFTPSSLEKN